MDSAESVGGCEYICNTSGGERIVFRIKRLEGYEESVYQVGCEDESR